MPQRGIPIQPRRSQRGPHLLVYEAKQREIALHLVDERLYLRRRRTHTPDERRRRLGTHASRQSAPLTPGAPTLGGAGAALNGVLQRRNLRHHRLHGHRHAVYVSLQRRSDLRAVSTSHPRRLQVAFQRRHALPEQRQLVPLGVELLRRRLQGRLRPLYRCRYPTQLGAAGLYPRHRLDDGLDLSAGKYMRMSAHQLFNQ